MAILRDVVFDCVRPSALARFWVNALDGYAVAAYDDAELERLRAAGIDDPEDDPNVLVEPTDPRMPRIWFQKVPEPKGVKNRLHLDLGTSDVGSETDRLISAGATELYRVGSRVTLADPEGNEFCLDEA